LLLVHGKRLLVSARDKPPRGQRLAAASGQEVEENWSREVDKKEAELKNWEKKWREEVEKKC